MSTERSRSGFGRTATRGGTVGATALGDTLGKTGRVAGRGRRTRRWWRRNRRTLQRRWRQTAQTVTPTGRFVLLVTILAGVLALSLAWVEASVVAVAGALLLLVALPFLLTSRAYAIAIKIDRSRVVAGGTVHASVDVVNSAARPALPATAELPVGDALRELHIPLIGPGGHTEIAAPVPALQRGVIAVGPVTLARRDPLGLLRREVTWRDRHRVHVHPLTATLPTGSAGLVRDLEGASSRRLTDSDLSFHAVRDYVHGDAMRHVHWRSTAKTGHLMVRQYEESQTARAAIIFDANRAEYASDEEFELAVSAAASLSLQAVREGRERYVASQWGFGRKRSSVDGLEEIPSRTPTQLLDAWAELEQAEDVRPIEWLARSLAQSRRPLSVVSLVTGSNPSVARLRRAAAYFPGDVAVVTVRAELLAEPAVQLLDVCTLVTLGAIGDLPQLMVRGGLG